MRRVTLILTIGAFLLCAGCDGGGGSGHYSAAEAFQWSLCIKNLDQFQGTFLNNPDIQSELASDAMGLWCWEADCVTFLSEILDDEENDSKETAAAKDALKVFFEEMEDSCGECRADREPPPNIKPKIDAVCEQTPNPRETKEA